MSSQHILNTGEVSGQEPTDVLEEFCQKATQQLEMLRESDQKETIYVAATIAATQKALNQAELILTNRRRGLDGMTPVQP